MSKEKFSHSSTRKVVIGPSSGFLGQPRVLATKQNLKISGADKITVDFRKAGTYMEKNKGDQFHTYLHLHFCHKMTSDSTVSAKNSVPVQIYTQLPLQARYAP